MILNKALKQLRILNNINQKDLANNLGISPVTINLIEKEKQGVPINILELYSTKFDIPISSIWLFAEQISDLIKISKEES